MQHSFWADSMEDEQQAWNDFLTVLSGFEKPVLIHYGSYENRFLKRMCERYGKPETNSGAGAALASPLNLYLFFLVVFTFPTPLTA